VINFYLHLKGERKTGQVLNLMGALLNRDEIEESDFRKREASFGVKKVQNFFEFCESEFDWFLNSEEASAERENRRKKTWEEMLLVDWDERDGKSVLDGKGSICPAFGCSLEQVQELIGSYSTKGKRKSSTRREK
jgi:hypothetical protein